jgi:hypothetical protein
MSEPDKSTVETTVFIPAIGGMKGSTSWTGGKPDPAWTKSENTRPRTPFCFRPDEEKDAKIYEPKSF